ncbi:MAG: hypothetical protein VYD64_07080 [Pseudomonadota bacterium]|nr:hypothetical protein [Pseudomonadota bacterium]
MPQLHTNEAFVGEVANASQLDIDDTMAVWRFVLGALPDRVSVIPTENYYYFHFHHGGVKYSGNIRLPVDERDKGLVEFIYFKSTNPWIFDPEDHHATLGADDGVMVEKVADLAYRVGHAGKSVVFELNDLSGVTPPPDALRDGETYLGPVADESGLRFFLVFDSALKLFQYVLDETVPVGDELVDLPQYDHILLGRRTGFAFLQESGRKLLVGVYGLNIVVNNYLDGPFDQLPDNFIRGDELRDALLLARPYLEGRINRLGIRPDGLREAIAPYYEYGAIEELKALDECAGKAPGAAVYRCLDRIIQDN